MFEFKSDCHLANVQYTYFIKHINLADNYLEMRQNEKKVKTKQKKIKKRHTQKIITQKIIFNGI